MGGLRPIVLGVVVLLCGGGVAEADDSVLVSRSGKAQAQAIAIAGETAASNEEEVFIPSGEGAFTFDESPAPAPATRSGPRGSAHASASGVFHAAGSVDAAGVISITASSSSAVSASVTDADPELDNASHFAEGTALNRVSVRFAVRARPAPYRISGTASGATTFAELRFSNGDPIVRIDAGQPTSGVSGMLEPGTYELVFESDLDVQAQAPGSHSDDDEASGDVALQVGLENGNTCGNTTLQLSHATGQGTLAATGPGTGQFRAGPGDQVYVGGFDLRPRFGGSLLLDTNTNTLTAEGAGVQVFLGRFEVPLDVSSLPVNLAEATVPLNRDGTLLKSLFSLPISGQLKAGWTDGGKGAGLEFELEAEKLLGNFGSFRGAGVTTPSLKVTAKQANCTGFDFTGAELKADELSFIPTRLRVPKKLGLRNVLFKYEETAGRSIWTGQGELILPVGSGNLSVGGKVTIDDGTLAGVGVGVTGINRRIGYGLFLQRVEGELGFRPEFGANFGVSATLGPEVQGKKLAKLTGNLKFLALASECTRGEDPIALVATGSVPLVEEQGAGSVKVEGFSCIYTDSLAIEKSDKVEAVFGEIVGGEIPNPVVAVRANLGGSVGDDGLNLEGGGTVTLPVIGEVGGRALMSTRAFAACGQVSFFSGGAVHVWGESRTEAFSGCDLAPWRAGAGASAFPRGARSATEPHARVSVAVSVARELPFVGWSVQGSSGPPRVRVTGPRGERFTSAKGRAVVRRDVVIVPVAAERRTFVFVKSPSVGNWRIDGIGERLTGVRIASGLPKPNVRGELVVEGVRQALDYTVAPIPGQRVTFYERTEDGITKRIGGARGGSGRIVFTPASSGQPARVEAVVEQNSLPRATVSVASFRAVPAAAKPPARPRRLTAKRAGRALVIGWARAGGASRYRVDVLAGRRRIARRTVTGTKLRLAGVPAGSLRVELRAISAQGAASVPARATVRAPLN